LASSTDRSEDILPRPELNPLLNPLLADNMGRWAEVYFTSPPEKREEAVLDLLRELQARDSGQQAAPGPGPGFSAPGAGSVTTERRIEVQRCDSCGQINPLRHQFCGMCGARLGSPASENFPPAADIYHSPEAVSGPALDSAYAEPREMDREPLIDDSVLTAGHGRDPYDLSLFQSLREKEVPRHFDFEQSPSVRYRYYIGAILAVLIFALGYMAWRGGQANVDGQSAPSPAAPVAADSTPAPANQNPAVSAPSNPPTNTEAQAAAPEKKPAEPSSARPAEASEHSQAGAVDRKAVPSSAPSAPPAPESIGQQNPEGGGAEEFNVAQNYMNGTNGQRRDGAEAAKWLWRAMAKHNGLAMVALADLYLKGDGVSKNCDQARVLLDSAALRGVAGAGPRLRNLQAFGCQ